MVVRAAEAGEGVEEDDDVLAELDLPLAPLDDDLGEVGRETALERDGAVVLGAPAEAAVDVGAGGLLVSGTAVAAHGGSQAERPELGTL